VQVWCLVFFIDPPTPDIYTLSLHDALPISDRSGCTGRVRTSSRRRAGNRGSPAAVRRSATSADSVRTRTSTCGTGRRTHSRDRRSEEHTSELQLRENLVCRLLLEKKKEKTK